MYFTILEKTPLNPVYLKSLWLMNSSQQASNFRWSVFLCPFSVQCSTAYFWFVESLTTQHKHNDFVLTENWWRQKRRVPPLQSLGSTCILVYRDCQSWSCRNIYVYSQAITALECIFTQEYSPVARLRVAGLWSTDGGGDPHAVLAWRVVPRADEEWWRFAVDHGGPKCRLLCRWAGCGLVWSLRSLIL